MPMGPRASSLVTSTPSSLNSSMKAPAGENTPQSITVPVNQANQDTQATEVYNNISIELRSRSSGITDGLLSIVFSKNANVFGLAMTPLTTPILSAAQNGRLGVVLGSHGFPPLLSHFHRSPACLFSQPPHPVSIISPSVCI
ncbi:hypothetical protein E2C01_013481 [Portunus trituberculatus]|uniref:Uncharacterized protein n=1 Tax=Portunus trituberculatus TaxID=210409 RepID=A0A5B7DH93_PORTR|nr:hypothetical protein [Portunus trituberculatus]